MKEVNIINDYVEGLVQISSVITYRIVMHEQQGDTYVKIVDEVRKGEVVEIRNGFFRIVTDVEYLPHVEHVDFNFVSAIEPPKQDIMSLLDWREKS